MIPGNIKLSVSTVISCKRPVSQLFRNFNFLPCYNFNEYFSREVGNDHISFQMYCRLSLTVFMAIADMSRMPTDKVIVLQHFLILTTNVNCLMVLFMIHQVTPWYQILFQYLRNKEVVRVFFNPWYQSLKT